MGKKNHPDVIVCDHWVLINVWDSVQCTAERFPSDFYTGNRTPSQAPHACLPRAGTVLWVIPGAPLELHSVVDTAARTFLPKCRSTLPVPCLKIKPLFTPHSLRAEV